MIHDFKEFYDRGNFRTIDLILKIKSLQNVTDILGRLISSRNNIANSDDLLMTLKSSLESLGYTLPTNYTQFMGQQQKLLIFFDEANPQRNPRIVQDWISPIQTLSNDYAAMTADAKLALQNYMIFLNTKIGTEMSALMTDFEKWYTAAHLDEDDLIRKATNLQNSTSTFHRLLTTLNILNGQCYPEDLLKVLKPSLESLGYQIPQKTQVVLREAQPFFQFDDHVNPPGVVRPLQQWIMPVIKLEATLKERKRRNQPSLGNYVMELGGKIKNGVSDIMNDFMNWYDSHHLRRTNLAGVTKELQNSSRVMQDFMNSLNQLGSSNQNLNKLLEILRPSMESLGYTIPVKVESLMRQQQPYIDLFNELNPTSKFNITDKWIPSIDKVKNELTDLRDWYGFCKDLEIQTGTYDWQLKKPKFPPVAVNWLTFLENECGIPVSGRIKEINRKLDGSFHSNVLERIMTFALKPTELRCGAETITVSGNYVKLSDVISRNWPMISQCGTVVGEGSKLEIYAAHTIFIDKDVMATGMELNLVMISPTWVVVGGGNVHINLDGLPGAPHNPEVAASGANSLWIGDVGTDGLEGKPGGPGGSFFGLAQRIQNKEKLRITSNGGKGGEGQRGGNGGNGGARRNAYWSDATYDREVLQGTIILFTTFYWEYQHDGFPGYPGGNGGHGGVRGAGGRPGSITIYVEGSSRSGVHFVAANGQAGEPGPGGDGGLGGFHSLGIECRKEIVFVLVIPTWSTSCSSNSYNNWKSASGTDGAAGTSTARFTESSPPNRAIVEWESIVSYKRENLKLAHSHGGNKFFNYLNNDPVLQKFYGVEAFVQELEIICQEDLESELPSFINRLEVYLKEHSRRMRMGGEQKKVFAYLLATAYSQLLLSDQDHRMGMVVGLGQYFQVVRTGIQKLKESSALVAIDDERKKMGRTLQEKIVEVRRFRDEVVTPAVHKAEVELKKQMRRLEREFEMLVMEAESNLDGSRTRLKLAMEEEESLKFQKVLGAVTTILRFTDVIGGVVSFVTKDLPQVWDSAQGIFNDMRGLATDIRGMGSEGGKGLGEILVSGQKLLESVGDLTQMVKGAFNQTLNGNSTRPTEMNMTALLGTEMALSLCNKFKQDDEKLARLEGLVMEAGANVKDAGNRKAVIEQTFIPAVETLSGSLQWMMADLQNKSASSSVKASETDIRKWQISWVLKGVKRQLEMLSKGVQTREFADALDRVQDSLIMQIDLIDDVIRYEETRKLSEYSAVLNSASLKNIQVRDPTLSSAVAQMDKVISGNALLMDYEKALHAFRQWVFPFAKLHLTKDLQINQGPKDLNPNIFVKPMETLQQQWERYKGATLSAHDTHLIHTNFSSSHKSSRPFFVWGNQQWQPEIRDLLAGQPVHLKADVRSSQVGVDAVKFKLIEINFKIAEGNQTSQVTQQSLNSELEHFGVIMTHSGLSYYRFQGKFYGMTGTNQTFRYNLERDRGTGNRLGTNRTYEKFRKGDYLLSPYTLWTIQLIRTASRNRSRQKDFQGLKRFESVVDLELVGTGIYVDGERMVGADMEVDKFYVRDESVRPSIEFEK